MQKSLIMMHIIIIIITTVLLVGLSAQSLPPPGHVLNLKNFVLQLPTGSNGHIDEVSQPKLETYTSSYFHTAPDNSVEFWCPVTGARTSGSQFPRTELRESVNLSWNNNGKGDWTFIGYHLINVTMKVVKVPPKTKKITIGQVHGATISGSCSIIIELFWSDGKIINAMRGPPPNNSSTSCPNHYVTLPGNYELDEMFSYSLYVHDKTVSVYTTKGGWSNSYTYSWWKTSGADTYWAYLKAGDYVQQNTGSSSDGGTVRIYDLTTYHSKSDPPA